MNARYTSCAIDATIAIAHGESICARKMKVLKNPNTSDVKFVIKTMPASTACAHSNPNPSDTKGSSIPKYESTGIAPDKSVQIAVIIIFTLTENSLLLNSRRISSASRTLR